MQSAPELIAIWISSKYEPDCFPNPSKNQSTASRPLRCKRSSSFDEGQLGCFSPPSHLRTVDKLVFNTAASTTWLSLSWSRSARIFFTAVVGHGRQAHCIELVHIALVNKPEAMSITGSLVDGFKNGAFCFGFHFGFSLLCHGRFPKF